MAEIIKFDRFTVIVSNTGETFLVDNDIADDICTRSWCKDTGGYMVANIDGKTVRLHDYVLEKNGIKKPKGYYVDHINQDKLDDRINNLRLVTPTESSKNMPLKGDNKSGVTGVCNVKNGRYRAYITVNKRQINLGCYGTLSEAASARMEAETRLGFKSRPKSIAFLCAMEDKILRIPEEEPDEIDLAMIEQMEAENDGEES